MQIATELEVDHRLLNILLVEDQKESQIITTAYLNNISNVTCVSNADAALAILQRELFDLILMDIALVDGIGGIELTKILRTDRRYDRVPIIAVTAYGLLEHKYECFEAGMNDFVSKPFTRAKLLETIRRWRPMN